MPSVRARLAALTAAVLLAPLAAGTLPGASGQLRTAATPEADCGPGSRPETDLQGRIPPADVVSGRAAAGYTCNTEQIGAFASSAGWRVLRYGDCAYYNGEPGGLPLGIATQPAQAGTRVMDVSDPTAPVETAFLRTPGMLSPHESMDLSPTRGLLVASVGNLATLPGVIDVYDVATDCRRPRLLASVNLGGLLGHEGSLSPDGRTYYVGSTIGNTLTAVDLTNPALPVPIAVTDVLSHGLSVSADGNTLYDAVAYGPNAGMVVYDVSAIQARTVGPLLVPGAGFAVLGKVTWPQLSIPQSTIPVTIGGRPYLVESDEFRSVTGTDAIGASRIIDIADPRAPRVVSELRLEVHEPENQPALADDTNAFIGGPYSGHFCSVPQLVEPGIVACSMLRSGVRVFDIRDPLQPREIAYFSPPARTDSVVDGKGLCSCLHTGSTVAFVPERGEMWVSGQESGFHVVRFTNGVWPFGSPAAPPTGPSPAAELAPVAPAIAGSGASATPRPGAASPTVAGPRLAATGAPALAAVTGLLLLAVAWAARRRTG